MRIVWVYRERRLVVKSVGKVCGSTVKLKWILESLSTVEVGGIRGVAVRCFFITMIRQPARSTPIKSSAASDVYKRQPTIPQ